MTTQETEVVAPEQDDSGTQTYEQQVSSALAGMKQDDGGKWVLPDGLSEDVRFSANTERRRRDTESALSKTRLQLKAQESVNEELTKRVTDSTPLAVSAEVSAELEELMYSDPQAWRAKMNELEKTASATTQTELNEMTSKASQQAELELRQNMLNKFNTEHPDTPLTDEVVANDLPPRITNQLAEGRVTFDEFLTLAHTYITTPKKVKGTPVEDLPNIGLAGGGASPSQDAIDGDTSATYQNTIF